MCTLQSVLYPQWLWLNTQLLQVLAFLALAFRVLMITGPGACHDMALSFCMHIYHAPCHDVYSSNTIQGIAILADVNQSYRCHAQQHDKRTYLGPACLLFCILWFSVMVP